MRVALHQVKSTTRHSTGEIGLSQISILELGFLQVRPCRESAPHQQHREPKCIDDKWAREQQARTAEVRPSELSLPEPGQVQVRACKHNNPQHRQFNRALLRNFLGLFFWPKCLPERFARVRLVLASCTSRIFAPARACTTEVSGAPSGLRK